MDSNFDDLNLIRKSFTGELSEEERRQFEERLKSDKEFAFNLELAKKIRAVNINDEVDEAFKGLKKKEKAPAQTYTLVRRIAAVALPLVLLAIAGTLLFNPYRVTTAEKDDQLDRVFASLDNQMGGSGDYQGDLREKEWEAAFDKLIQSCNPCDDPEDNYNLGILFLYLKRDYPEAIKRFKVVIDVKRAPNDFLDEELFLARAYLANRNKKAARSLIQDQASLDNFPELQRLLD